MKKSILATAAFVLATSALSFGVQAEEYNGVQSITSSRDSAEVSAEAVKAAHAPNQNVTRGSRGADPFTSTADSAAVSKQAWATSHARDQNVVSGSRVNSKVVSTWKD